VLVKITPPKEPTQLKTAHVPCDIVLALEVPASMQRMAPIHEEEDGSIVNTVYTVLEIVKQTALTILETLDESNRLGLVTFSDVAKVNKHQIEKTIRGLNIEYGTNIWDGVETGRDCLVKL